MSLETLATKALAKASNDIEIALPHFLRMLREAKLIDELARDYLRGIVGRRTDRGPLETQGVGVGSTPLAADVGSIKVRDYKVPTHRRRTHEEKEAAEKAMLVSADAVFDMRINGRAIGAIAIGELTTMRKELYDNAARGIVLHIIDVQNAIIAEQIEQHCSAMDQMTPVRQVIAAKTLEEFVQRAKMLAPRRVEEGVRHARVAMENRELLT